jgi:hypothetical protein
MVLRFRDTEYFVTTCGRVWSAKTRKFMAHRYNGDGYDSVCLRIDGSSVYMRVHRMVAEVYVDNPHGKQYVNHIDGVKHHNHAQNLEWVTHSENIIHAVNTGLIHTDRCMENGLIGGEVRAKACRKPLLGINATNGYIIECDSVKDAGISVNIDRSLVGRRKGTYMTAGGYRWILRGEPRCSE